MSHGRDSFDVCMVAREITPSAVGRESTALNVGNDIFDHMPFSVGGREGTTLNAGNGVVGDTPYSVGGREGTTPNVSNDTVGDTLYSVDGREGTTPNVGQDKSSRVERTMVGSNHGDNIVPTLRGVRSRRDDRDAG
uniref:Uncharacterized protein n=1 Tax=Peronospora matthiolae TaxID=2874970 RepID=A0AAV1T518_9STRA